MTKYLIVIIYIATISLAIVFGYQKQQTVYTQRIQALEDRLDKASSKMWILKTQLDFPNFPPKVGIKMTDKFSMKLQTKGKIND